MLKKGFIGNTKYYYLFLNLQNKKEKAGEKNFVNPVLGHQIPTHFSLFQRSNPVHEVVKL